MSPKELILKSHAGPSIRLVSLRLSTTSTAKCRDARNPITFTDLAAPRSIPVIVTSVQNHFPDSYHSFLVANVRSDTCSKVFPVEDGYHCPVPKLEGRHFCENRESHPIRPFFQKVHRYLMGENLPDMTCGSPSCPEVGSYDDDKAAIWYCENRTCYHDYYIRRTH